MNKAPESHLKVSICLMSPYLLNGLRICGNNLMVARITVESDKRTMKLFFYSAELKKNRQSPSLSGPVARLIRCFVASRVIAVGERGGETSKKEYQRW